MHEEQVITNSQAANFLTKDNNRRLLGPFIEQEISLGEAAEKLAMKLSTLHYHVKKMLELKLLRVSRREIINGHVIKFYTTTSPVFIVPLESTSSVDLETHVEELFARSNKILAKAVVAGMLGQANDWAFRIFFIPNFGVVQAVVGKDEQGIYKSSDDLAQPQAYFAADGELKLNKEDAFELQVALDELYQKYLLKRRSIGQAYWLQLGLASMTQKTEL